MRKRAQQHTESRRCCILRLIKSLPPHAGRGSIRCCCVQVGALTTSYPDFFKKSAVCKRPHLIADKLRDDLFKAKVRGGVC